MSKAKTLCSHENKIKIIVKNKDYDKIVFCKECQGIILIGKNKEIARSVTHFTKKENLDFINPIILYEKMRNVDNNSYIYFDNSFKEDRKDIITFITKLVNKYKTSEETFYLSILFLDIIFSKIIKNNAELDLIAIGSFFLAGELR